MIVRSLPIGTHGESERPRIGLVVPATNILMGPLEPGMPPDFPDRREVPA